MAGSSTGWKTGGSSAKGKVFVSNAAIMAYFGPKANIAAIKKDLDTPEFGWLVDNLAKLSTQPGGQAKSTPAAPAAPAKPAPSSGTISVTQSNGKKVSKEAIVQGGLAVVTTPYGHAVVHTQSGKALLYIDGDKQLVYNDYKKKTVLQSAPSGNSQAAAVSAMDTLNSAPDAWNTAEAEALGPEAQAALKDWAATNKGTKQVAIDFKPSAAEAKAPAMPAPAPADVPGAPDPEPSNWMQAIGPNKTKMASAASMLAAINNPPPPAAPKPQVVKQGPEGMAVVKLPNGAYQVQVDGKPLGGEYTAQAGATKLMNKTAGLAGAGPAAAKAAPSAPKVATPKTPTNWASSPTAKALADAQKAGDMSAGDPAELAFIEAFRTANPHIKNYSSSGYHKSSYEAGYKQLASYQGNGYTGVNNALWSTARTPDGKLLTKSATARALQKLALSASAPFDMTVTRAVRSSHPLATWAKDVQVGGSYINKGFDSSSTNPGIKVHGNDVQIRMRVPEGAKGISMRAVFPGSMSSEQEWLVPANSTWIVTGKRTLPDGKLEVTVDLVGQQDFSGKSVWP